MLRINSNLAANIALGGLRTATVDFTRSSERLASGRRINHPSDEPSTFVGLNLLKSQIAGIGAAAINTQRASNTLGVAQDGITSIYDRLVKLRSLSLRALGSDIASSDRNILQDEANQILADIDRIANDTKLGGNRILNGSGDFFIDKTNQAFDDIRIKRLKFGGQPTRDFTVDLTRVAERATLITNLDLGGYGDITQGSSSVLAIEGPRGSSQIAMAPNTTAAQLMAQVNGASELTGMYASTQVVNGAESPVTQLALADQELVGQTSFTLDITVGGSATTVTVNTTDIDGDGNGEITGADIERALNSADLGNFTVIEGTDAAGDKNLIIRHAGAENFTIDNPQDGGTGALQGAIAQGGGMSINGVEPTSARLISDGLNFDPTGQTLNFDIEVYGGGAGFNRPVVVNGTDATFNNGADLQAAFAEVATVTHLGTDASGQEIFVFTAIAGVDGFRFAENNTGGNDARNIGLLSHSGGSTGLASKGMGVLALYSEDFGSNQSISIRNAGYGQLAFNALNQTSSAVAGMAPQGVAMRADGVDAVAFINDTQVKATNGFHFAYGSSYADIDIDLAQRFGPGSFTNTITTALNLSFATAGTQSLLGYRPVSNIYDGNVFNLTQPNNAAGDPTSAALQNAGIIDRITFEVHKTVPNSSARSGLGVQLTGEAGGREFIGIRNFDISYLGGLPSAEGLPGTASSRLFKGAGTLSQIARDGIFSLEGPKEQIAHSLAIIDRAIDQTLSTQTALGTYEVATLNTNRDFLEGLQHALSGATQDIETTDVAREVTEMSRAQLSAQAATSVLAQANSFPQTLLTLLR